MEVRFVDEFSLAGIKKLARLSSEDAKQIVLKPMEIRTFELTVNRL
jgi:hypothetical protein